MDEEINVIERNNTSKWFDLSNGGQPIDKNQLRPSELLKEKEQRTSRPK